MPNFTSHCGLTKFRHCVYKRRRTNNRFRSRDSRRVACFTAKLHDEEDDELPRYEEGRRGRGRTAHEGTIEIEEVALIVTKTTTTPWNLRPPRSLASQKPAQKAKRRRRLHPRRRRKQNQKANPRPRRLRGRKAVASARSASDAIANIKVSRGCTIYSRRHRRTTRSRPRVSHRKESRVDHVLRKPRLPRNRSSDAVSIQYTFRLVPISEMFLLPWTSLGR